MKNKKILNSIEYEAIAEGYGMLIYDDLKMEKVAQAKLMNDLQIEKMKLIE